MNDKKVYIEIGTGVCFKPDGWTGEQFEQFQDKMIEVAESFGEDVQFTTSWRLMTEAEMEADLNKE